MSNKEPRSTNVGIIALAVKFLPKIISAAGKVLKGATVLKGVGAAASIGLYTFLLTWEMAIALVLFILVHEYGHLSAMKSCGIKTKGIFLIPGFGGAAVAAEGFKSARNEAYIAIMGPVYGLYFVFASLVVYHFTGELIFAAIASIMTFINLVNLFPINPLDGGRIVKSLLYSFHESTGFSFMIFSLILAGALSYYLDFGLLLLVAAIGLLEVLSDYGLMKRLSSLLTSMVRAFVAFLCALSLHHLSKPDIGTWLLTLHVSILAIVIVLLVFDMMRSSIKFEKSIVHYPLIVLWQAYDGLKSLLQIKHSDLVLVEKRDSMKTKQVLGYSLSYVGIIILHITLIVYTSGIPGSGLALEMLK